MHDLPTAALKTKRHSSIAVGLHLQQDGKAHAFVSAGNTGAVLSAATLILGRINGVGRPTIGALVPTAKRPVPAGGRRRQRRLPAAAPAGVRRHGLDLHLRHARNIPNPRVGLLSIGEEDSKGNEVSLAALQTPPQERSEFRRERRGTRRPERRSRRGRVRRLRREHPAEVRRERSRLPQGEIQGLRGRQPHGNDRSAWSPATASGAS